MPDTSREVYMVCPHCWSVRVKTRTFKDPRYKCEKCGKEFSNKKRITHEQRKTFNKITKKLHQDSDFNNITEMGVIRYAIDEVKELDNNA